MGSRMEAALPSQRTLGSAATVAAGAILALLAASYVINAADRQVFPVLLPSVNAAYGFSLAQGGFLATIFTLGIGLGGIPTGYLLDRVSLKAAIAIGIVIYSVFTLATAVAFGFVDMAVYRAVSGIGEAMQNAALFSAVGAYFYARRSLALGALNLSYGIGGFLGPLIGADLLVATGTWKTPLVVLGAIGFAFVVLILLLVNKRFTEAVARTQAPDASANPAGGAVFNRNTVVSAITAAVAGLALYGYLGLYPTYLQQALHFSPSDAGLAASMFGIGSMVASLPAGYLGDRWRQRWVIVGSLLLAMLVGFVLFNVPASPPAETVLSFLEGAFASGFIFVNLYALIQRSVAPELVGRASGLFVTSFYLPAAVAGYLFATLVGSVSWGGAALAQLGALPILGIVSMLFLDESRVRG